MMRFIRGRSAAVNAERQKLQKELFGYKNGINIGFPPRPSALAYDPKLSLIAIGTKNSVIRVYGQPGVEFQAIPEDEQQKSQAGIAQLLFIENAGQLVSLHENNAIHLWQVQLPEQNEDNDCANLGLQLVKSCLSFVQETSGEEDSNATEDRNQITTISWVVDQSCILIGTQNGKVHLLNTDTFEIDSGRTIMPETVLLSVPEEHRKGSPGEVELIKTQPKQPQNVLIGYNRGLMALWNLKTNKVENVYLSNQRLESVHWLSCGQRFLSAHNDGSYLEWSIDDHINPSIVSNMVYGPFPCKPINKIYGNFCSDPEEDFVIFSGGMPRQTCSDKHAVSIIYGLKDSPKQQQALDFTSRIIDFVVIEQPATNRPSALFILAEEEMVAIDLTHPEWLQFELPYLSSIHSSPITCCQTYSGIHQSLMDNLRQIDAEQKKGRFSTNSWPVTGGILKPLSFTVENEILITGHEDGSVRLWDVSNVYISHLYSLSTLKLFFSPDDDIIPIDGDEMVGDENEEWPPFRKVGVFDPFSDDPRLGIRKIALCSKTQTLAVAGTAGQLIIYELKTEARQTQLSFETMNLVSDCDGFVWKSHDKLHIRTGTINSDTGFQPRSMLQLYPPASVTSLALQTDWGLVAVGTSHGFGIFDYTYNTIATVKCTLNPADLSSVSSGDLTINRRKSFKKTLRDSFRRLRRGRSQRQTKKPADKSSIGSPVSQCSPRSKISSNNDMSGYTERQIEAKSDDSFGSIVRYLYFTKAPICNAAQSQPSLWAGTSAGRVFIYVIKLASEDASPKETAAAEAAAESNSTPAPSATAEEPDSSSSDAPKDVKAATNEKTVGEPTIVMVAEPEVDNPPSKPECSCILAKEIQLKHHAPVIFIHTIDPTGKPSDDISEISDKSSIPKVLICSEQQFKLFNLPTLKPFGKFKLTAHEGSKARRFHLCKFVSKVDPSYHEFGLCNICNQGDVGIYSILDLKRQLQSNCIRKDDLLAISNAVFADNGDGFFLSSSSEFSRFWLSPAHVVIPCCTLDKSSLVRIMPKRVEEEPTVEASTEAKTSAEHNEQADQAKVVEKEQTSATNIVTTGVSTISENKPIAEIESESQSQTNTTQTIVEEEPQAEASIAETIPESTEQPAEVLVKQDGPILLSAETEVKAEVAVEQQNGNHVTAEVHDEIADDLHELQETINNSLVFSNGNISDSELFDDSKVDEDTVIDHIETANGNGKVDAAIDEPLIETTIASVEKKIVRESRIPVPVHNGTKNGGLQAATNNGDASPADKKLKSEQAKDEQEDRGIDVIENLDVYHNNGHLLSFQ